MSLLCLATLVGCRETAKAPIRVACVGDSITYGWLIPDRETACYPAQLQTLLGAKYEVRNFGVGGATVLASGEKPYAAHAMCQQALAFAPQIVVFQLGTNDARSHWRPDEFVPAYLALVERFRAVNAAVTILIVLPPPATDLGEIRGDLVAEEILPMVRQVASDGQGSLVELSGLQAPQMFVDGVHPTASGAKLIAAQVARVIQDGAGREAP